MTQTVAIQASATLLSELANPAARALLLAAGAALALAAFRVRTTSLRLFTWTAVLYAALAMPLLGRMLPPLAVPTPAFLQFADAQSAPELTHDSRTDISAAIPSRSKEVSAARHYVVRETATMTSSPEAIHPPSPKSLVRETSTPTAKPVVASSEWPSISWSAVVTGLYLTVTLLLLVRFVVGLVFGRRLRKASEKIEDPRVTQRLAARARACRLALLPGAAESELISVPVTMGAIRSTILLPASWPEWDDAKLDAVVAHEISHVARRDALTQRLSLLHRAIFWFSPLAWWLDRHLADLAEQASDEAALSCGADRHAYARTLLGFFEALQAAPGRVWWQGVSMAKAGQAEQRLERILDWRGAVTMSLKKSIAVAIIALAIPVVYLAAAVRPAGQVPRPHLDGVQAQTPPQAQSASPATPGPAPEAAPPSSTDGYPVPVLAPVAPGPMAPPRGRGPIAGVVSKGGYMVIPPAAPGAPRAAVPPPAIWGAQASGSGSSHRGGFSYAHGYDDEQRFVIVSGKSDSYTMSGSTEDIRHVDKLKKTISGDFIWFQRDEKSYIIRDQATVDNARKLWLPQEELGKKQEELGKQQEALGKQQEELGAKMEQITVKVPDMSAEIDKLKAELKQLSSGATVEQVGRIQSEIGELQSKIGEIQSHAGDQQGKLGEEMGALGEKQGKLGAQQGELGRQQGELAQQAVRQMRDLLDDAIKKGTAQPEPETGGSASL
ncbi:MAG TPA: M56 family metallopeptidase [Candidatus Sulfotelmatobacter sp.]|jgi:beta-lactamase regulating signal transducer with metallopeptidase domain|nr:M56 family metallopeptidase [Candidatus Sulfotelmatobacter sp.]